jgi:dGTPase
MDWEKLLSLKKHGDTKTRTRLEEQETRVGFEVDFDRVIFSNEFRSLQDKTQVIPLSKTDFVHTRLTHSLEVSVVGRTLGRVIGQHILNNNPKLKTLGYQVNDFGAIVAAAALFHDVGNPPFGHSGEKAIGEYFAIGKGKIFKDKLSPKQWQDLIDFEGNANGFKILNEGKDGVGIRLSYATIGAFLKYPKQSLPQKPSKHIAHKKYNVFQADLALFDDVIAELGLKSLANNSFTRHPLAYLVEAADDICYTIIDFEDGINLGLIPEDYALEYLTKLVRKNINSAKYNALTTTKSRISYLRALAINTLIGEAITVFKANEEAILKGEFPYSLLDKCQYEAQINDIIRISIKNIYKSNEVVEKELAGYQILGHLLDVFIEAVNHKALGAMNNYDKLVLQLLPEKMQQLEGDLYYRLLQIASYVASLSDGIALLLYRKIKGMEL